MLEISNSVELDRIKYRNYVIQVLENEELLLEDAAYQ